LDLTVYIKTQGVGIDVNQGGRCGFTIPEDHLTLVSTASVKVVGSGVVVGGVGIGAAVYGASCQHCCTERNEKDRLKIHGRYFREYRRVEIGDVVGARMWSAQVVLAQRNFLSWKRCRVASGSSPKLCGFIL
jgi:hypothetical protein